MEQPRNAKKLIKEAKNIALLPLKDSRPEIIPLALALFYTLKKINKDVNLIIDDFPKKFQFLVPSLNFISYPRDFVISFPNSKAEISRIRYEKDKYNLKFYLTLERGEIKKSDISLNLTGSFPELLISIAVKNKSQLKEFFGQNQLNFSIVNIDSFDTAFNLIKSIDNNLFDKDIATCLLTSLVILSENFQNQTISPVTFEAAAFLIKKGALHKEIIHNLSQSETLLPTKIFSKEENLYL